MTPYEDDIQIEEIPRSEDDEAIRIVQVHQHERGTIQQKFSLIFCSYMYIYAIYQIIGLPLATSNQMK